MAERSKCYKWCFVPGCKNTTISTPNKIFVTVPRNEQVRRKWAIKARRDDAMNMPTCMIFCCEDHFTLEEDMENWMKYKLMGGNIKMKAGVLPHKFNCQLTRTTASHTKKPRRAFEKRQRSEQIQELLLGSSINDMECEDSPFSCSDIACATSNINVPSEPLKSDKAVQINMKPHVRSRGTSIRGNICPTNSSCSPIKPCVSHVAPSPVKHTVTEFETEDTSSQNISRDSEQSSSTSSDESEVDASNGTLIPSDSDSFTNEAEEETLKRMSIARTKLIIKRNPRTYIGIQKDCLFLIDILVEKTRITYDNIILCLKKIRMNDSFLVLSHDFGMSESNASRIFKKCVPVLASFLKELIIWPDTFSIVRLLPIPFRARFSRVEAIIDCLEIEIEKPSSPVEQALTWSEYKKCNTIKYLISSTPDGLINFVSSGYGGRSTDLAVVEDCGFLDHLKSGQEIMADRGFKHLNNLLSAKGCKLVRPPSVSAGTKSTTAEVKESKRIASLRIHIERVIRRVREFKSLAPHSCTDNKMVGVLDYFVIIACGLINMQSSLIK